MTVASWADLAMTLTWRLPATGQALAAGRKLEQVRPGWFQWTTPAGRTYTTGPDIYPV